MKINLVPVPVPVPDVQCRPMSSSVVHCPVSLKKRLDKDWTSGTRTGTGTGTKLISVCCFLALFFIFPPPLHADPWGKDADLACRSYCQNESTLPSRCPTPIFDQFANIMIRFHQDVISPADGPRSHYTPSSSQYALDAIKKYGFFQGVSMGCDRLMRENKDPWVYRVTFDGAGRLIKYDPVP